MVSIPPEARNIGPCCSVGAAASYENPPPMVPALTKVSTRPPAPLTAG
jgi:hypothetical protein